MEHPSAEACEQVAPVWPRIINAIGIGMFAGAALASLSASVYWRIALMWVAVIVQLSGGVLLWRVSRSAANAAGGSTPPGGNRT